MTVSCCDRLPVRSHWAWLAAPAGSFALALGAGLLLMPLAGPAAPLAEPLADLWDLICRTVPVGMAEAAGSPMETTSAPAMPLAARSGDNPQRATPVMPQSRPADPASAPGGAWLFEASPVPVRAAPWPGRQLTAPPLPPVFLARAGRGGT